VSLCFGTLRQLRHLRRYITDDLLPSLVVSLIHSRLDCGNFILVGYQLTYSDTFSLWLCAQRCGSSGVPASPLRPITDAVATLHWLRLPERVDFKVTVMAFRVLHGLALSYLDQLVRVADLPGRHRLRSSTFQLLHVQAYRLTTVGRRSFPVAASVIWNSLPSAVQSSATLSVFFCQRLKTYLFRKSFPDFPDMLL